METLQETKELIAEINEKLAEAQHNLTQATVILRNLTDERTDFEIAAYEAEQERNYDHALDNQF